MIEFSGKGLALHLADDAMRQMVREVRRHRRSETGGVLIGFYSEDLCCVHVLEATGPGRFSFHAPFAFMRGVKDLQRAVDSAGADGLYYVGEWHSHPGRSASPSAQDIRQMQEISASDGYNCPEPVLIVIGGADPLKYISAHVIMGKRTIELKKGVSG